MADSGFVFSVRPGEKLYVTDGEGVTLPIEAGSVLVVGRAAFEALRPVVVDQTGFEPAVWWRG